MAANRNVIITCALTGAIHTPLHVAALANQRERNRGRRALCGSGWGSYRPPPRAQPLMFDGQHNQPSSAPPLHGEYTREILGELGFRDAETSEIISGKAAHANDDIQYVK